MGGVLEILRDFSLELSSVKERQRLYAICLERVGKVLSFDCISIFLIDKDESHFVLAATHGFPAELLKNGLYEDSEGLPEYVLQSQELEVVPDFRNEERFVKSDEILRFGLSAAAAVPMIIADAVFGVIIGYNKKARHFTENDGLLFQIVANHIAIAIKNVMHREFFQLSELRRERKMRELQEERRISRERSNEFESIFSNIVTGVVLLKPGRVIARCNQKFADMLGYGSPEDLIGQDGRILHFSDEEYRSFGAKFYGGITADRIVEGEYTLKKRDGGSILCKFSGRPTDQSAVADIDKGFVWIIEDITRKKEMEEEILKARKLESIGILAGGIGHDFNNILSAILGNIGLAQRIAGNNSQVEELLASAMEAGEKAKELTAKLLFFTRREGHPLGSVHLHELLKEVNFTKFLRENVELIVDVGDDLFCMKIMPDHLKAILQNLLLNADACMTEGKGSVHICGRNIILADEELPGMAGGRYVEITVKDNGCGISTEYLENIFDPYFTTQSRDSSKGIGLGLAIVHSIVTKNYGHIRVKSNGDNGTVFTLILPAAKEIEK